MKVTYNWLKEFVNFSFSPKELVNVLEDIGIGVEEIIEIGTEFAGKLKVAKITKIEEIPSKRDLKILEIDTGKSKYRVVSSAPNVQLNALYIYAPLGSMIKGKKIGIRNFNGINSEGMLISLEDMGLVEKSEGLFILDRNFEVGEDPLPKLSLPDWVYNLEITPQRGDLLGVLGVAREIAAYSGLNLKKKEIDIKTDLNVPVFPVEIEKNAFCSRYIGRVIKDVHIAPSPCFLQVRLLLVGLRPINNIVDITNYVMLETAQPLHAFDLNLLNKKILVRMAKKGEKILCLDGVQRELDEKTMVIADAEKPCAIAGIIGGVESSITEKTRNILLESAYFDPVNIRLTRKRLKIDTESSYRFERKADWKMVFYAQEIASYLFQEIAGGKVGVVNDKEKEEFISPVVSLREKRMEKVLGFKLPFNKAKEYLERLGFELVEKDVRMMSFRVPSFRRDIEIEEDLIEEVARMYGYEKILEGVEKGMGFVGRRKGLIDSVRSYLCAKGFWESITISFIGKKEIELFGFKEENCILIQNPMSVRFSHLRPSIIPTLLFSVQNNIRKGAKLVSLFEIGKVFFKKDGEFQEKKVLCVIITGEREKVWYEKQRIIDYYDLKGIFDAICDKFLPKLEIKEENLPFLTKSLSFQKNGENIGFIGVLEPRIKEYYDIPYPVYCMEIEISLFQEKEKEFKPLFKFPPLFRDLSFICDKGISYYVISNAVEKFKKNSDIESFKLIDVYSGNPLAPGKQNITIRLVFRKKSATLQEDEVEKQVQNLVKYIEQNTPFTFRRI